MKKEKKQKKQSIYKDLFAQIMVGAVFGAIIGAVFIFYHELPSEYLMIPTWGVILMVIGCFYINIIVHELTHFYYFIKGKIPMKALYITIFVFIKEDGKWRFKFNPNPLTFMGGIAIPEMSVIKTEEDFKSYCNAFSKVLIAAPIATIILTIIGVIIGTIMIISSTNPYLLSFGLLLIVVMIIIGLLLTISSLFKNEQVIGDFPAHKLAKTDELFTATQFVQYLRFENNYYDLLRTNFFLDQKISNILLERNLKNELPNETLNYISGYIQDYLIGYRETIDSTIQSYIEYIIDNPNTINRNKLSMVEGECQRNILLYLVKSNEIDKAKELYVNFYDNLKEKMKLEPYIINQINYLMGHEDNLTYLEDITNLEKRKSLKLFKIFPEIESCEKQINNLILEYAIPSQTYENLKSIKFNKEKNNLMTFIYITAFFLICFFMGLSLGRLMN